ncbi:MAG: hypothetical protein AAGB14_06150 [Verrucomicrobiota bacterium]
MIIPDTLRPLPVTPATAEGKSAPEKDPEDFVSEAAVRQLLVGPMKVSSMNASRVPAGDVFAGRDDLSEAEAKPFVPTRPTRSCRTEPAKAFKPSGPHPALSKPRTAAPPRPRIEVDAGMKSRRLADHWWVLGMGAAMLAIIASGALIELVSREGQTASEPPPASVLGSETGTGSPSFVASNPEYPAP